VGGSVGGDIVSNSDAVAVVCIKSILERRVVKEKNNIF